MHQVFQSINFIFGIGQKYEVSDTLSNQRYHHTEISEPIKVSSIDQKVRI